MAIGSLLRQPIQITMVTETGPPDDYNNPTPEETQVDTLGYLEQRSRREVGAEGRVQRERWLLVVAPGVPLDGWAKVKDVKTGVTFEVHGPPWPVYNPRTQQVHHVEAWLEAAA